LPIQGLASELHMYINAWIDYLIVHQTMISPFETFEFHFEVRG